MKKLFAMIGISFLVFSFLLVSAKAIAVDKYCVDSDNLDIWTSGYTTDEKGFNYDDCDGESENLKEFTCDDDKTKLDNIKCTDYNAYCVDDQNGAYCSCDKGFVFVQDTCVPEDYEVPEFGVVAASVAMIGALGVFAFTRRKK